MDDPAMLKLLSEPGEHAVVITVLAGNESDLLDGVLRVSIDDGHDDHAYGISWQLWAVGGLIVFLALVIIWQWRNRVISDALTRKLSGGKA